MVMARTKETKERLEKLYREVGLRLVEMQEEAEQRGFGSSEHFAAGPAVGDPVHQMVVQALKLRKDRGY